MVELYPSSETQQLKKQVQRLTWLTWLTAAAALAVCIVCCMRVTTLTALRLQWTAVAASTAGGWMVILLHQFALAPQRALWQHAEGLAQGERETLTGVLTLRREAFHIPHSVTVCRVLLEGDEAAAALNVAERKARLLPPNGTRVRVTAVRRYIVAWEVCREDD